MMEPPCMNKDKDKVTTRTSAVKSVPDMYQSSSQEQTMDVLCNDKVLFSTPQVNLRDDYIQDSATLSAGSIYSVDSGFSDATFNSTWASSVNDMSSLSAQSFPDSGYSCRRLTLKTGDFSPINRGSLTSLYGRRLTFGEFEDPPPAFQLPQAETCENDYDESFEESVRSNNLCMDQDENVLLTKQSNMYDNNSSSLHSVIADGLQDSLQEMVIDELPSSSPKSILSPVHLCKNCQGNDCVSQTGAILLPHWHSSTVDMKTSYTPGICCTDLAASCSNKFLDNASVPYTSQTSNHDSPCSSHNDFRYSNNSNSKTHHHREDGCFQELSLVPDCQEESQMQIGDDQQYSFRKPKLDSSSEAFEVFQNNKAALDSHSFLNCRAIPYSDNPSQRMSNHLPGVSVVNNHETYSIKKFEQSDLICDEKLSPQDTRLTPHFHSLYSSDVLETDTTPHINLHIVKHTADSLQQIIKKFSPSEPTRLIGRNVGVRKVDIVQELYSKSIYPGLHRIFHYLASTDLISIANVSTLWKLALLSDKKAHNRYRQHKKSLSKNNVQHGDGKENHGEKSLDIPSEPFLTESKGLLSSVQSQAIRRVLCEPPPTVTIQDTLMSDDVLRICPRCQGPAVVKHRQDRATCMSEKCTYDFCTLCFSFFHHPRQCKPLCTAPSKGDLAGTRKSKKNLKRL